MESKLKSLKVTELKALLQKAGASSSGKTKADLIKAILASPVACSLVDSDGTSGNAAAVHTDNTADDDLLNPPADDQPASAATQQVPAQKPPTSATPSSPPKNTIAVTPTASGTGVAAPGLASTNAASARTQDEIELERRKKRAERFNIPLVETAPSKSTPKAPAATAGTKKAASKTESDERLKKRAERFGLTDSKSKSAVSTLSPEEEEKKRKRAERFGLVNTTPAPPPEKKAKTDS
jgi:SAP domain-containing ribonucleoprotein